MNDMRVVLLHGYNASPEMNFHPWLKKELESKGYEVIVPTLPLGDEPSPLEAIKAVEEAVGVVDENTIILGHSLGGVLALRFLEAMEAVGTPRAVILVASPWYVNSEKVKSFFMTEFDFDVVMWKAQEFVVVHSKDDQAVPFDHAEKYAKVLNAQLLKTEGDDHYAGAQYPILLETIIKKSEPISAPKPGEELPDDYEQVR